MTTPHWLVAAKRVSDIEIAHKIQEEKQKKREHLMARIEELKQPMTNYVTGEPEGLTPFVKLKKKVKGVLDDFRHHRIQEEEVLNKEAFFRGFIDTLSEHGGKWNPLNWTMRDVAPTWVRDKIVAYPGRSGVAGAGIGALGLGALGGLLAGRRGAAVGGTLGAVGGALGGAFGADQYNTITRERLIQEAIKQGPDVLSAVTTPPPKASKWGVPGVLSPDWNKNLNKATEYVNKYVEDRHPTRGWF